MPTYHEETRTLQHMKCRCASEDTYILTRMELGATLANDYIAGYHGLVWTNSLSTWPTGMHQLVNGPENFLRPKRLPGEPPWL
jgi:hypothetical protein